MTNAYVPEDDFETRTAAAAQASQGPGVSDQDDDDKAEPAPAAEPAVEAKPAKGKPITMSSGAFSQRQAEAAASATKKLLAEVGFASADELKEALTAVTELRAAADELGVKAARSEALQARLAAVVNDQLAALPSGVRKVVEERAGDDPERRLDLLAMFKEAGVLLAANDVPTAATGPAATPAGPAATLPLSAPREAVPSPMPAAGAPKTKFSEWQSMKARDPLLGNLFYQANMAAIERSRPAGS